MWHPWSLEQVEASWCQGHFQPLHMRAQTWHGGWDQTWERKRWLLAASQHELVSQSPFLPDEPAWRWEVRLRGIILVQIRVHGQEGPPQWAL